MSRLTPNYWDDWKDMPAPEPCITLSWEDIVQRATGIDGGLVLTREQVIDIMSRCESWFSKSEPLYDVFWDVVTQCIEDRNKD